MLAIDNLSFSYDTIRTLHNVSAEMKPGRVTCVMGRNGVGKTTLMKLVMGTLRPDSGSIRLDDTDLTDLPANRRARQGIALVPQGRQIFPKLTVEENLRVGLQASRNRGGRSLPDDIFELFPILDDVRKRPGGNLSGGMQQQLAIARALVGRPSVLLLDEPTEGIQPNIIQQIGRVLTELVERQQMTVVLVEQYLDFVKEIGHDFYIMNRGQMIAEGSTSDLTQDLVTKYLSV